MFLLLLIMSVTSSFVSAFWMSRSGGLHAKWYLLLTRSAVQQALLNFVTFFILFYNMIPISLYVTIEIVKLWQVRNLSCVCVCVCVCACVCVMFM